jgi:hypothetical protein
VYNTREFGIKEGAQNFSMWGTWTCILLSITGFETYQYWLRLCARGDTCPACEEIRNQKRMRDELNERQSGLT